MSGFGLPALRTLLRREKLEHRDCPAVTATLLNGVLTILGDSAANTIAVTASGSNINVSGIGSYASSQVSLISIDAGAGNDTITIGSGVGKPTWAFGNSGDDRIVMSNSANDQLYGGGGNDYLDGGAGNDFNYGGYGSDTVADSQGSNVNTDGSPYQTAGNSSVEQQIVTLVNQQRAANNLSPLSINTQLNFAASLHSTQMAQQSDVQGEYEAMSHTLNGVALPTGVSRANYAGYEHNYLGENIAFGYTGAADVMVDWMASTGHRANILNVNYTEIGVSVKAAPSGLLYFTQVFGKPQVPTGGTTPPPVTPPPVTPPPTTPAPRTLVATGVGAGGLPRVTTYDAATGTQRSSFDAYASSFRGGVRVATGDVNGDGYDDVVTAPGRGGGPHIQVFDGQTGAIIRSFFAYTPSFTGGVFVATADVNADGKADIITGAGAGGGPHVTVFSGANGAVLHNFYAYAPSFIGGVNVAGGDINGDGRADIITGAGPGGGPQVRVFNGSNLANIVTFYAYSPNFLGGVSVATGDVNGDGRADIITGAGLGGGPHVQVFSGTNYAVLQSFFAYGSSFTGGVMVAAVDQNGDNRADILTGGGAGANNPVKAFNALTSSSVRTYNPLDAGFMGGVFVG